jgi:hypothetical protein
MCRYSIALKVLLPAALSLTIAHFVASGANGQSPAGDATRLEAFHGVLLLRNGSTIEGEISRVGDHWSVKNEGRVLTVLARNVDLAGASLEDLYDAQRKRINRPAADIHLSLADWCIQNRLFEQASQQLAEARTIDPRDPRRVMIEQRLAIAIEQQARQAPAAATTVSAELGPASPEGEPIPASPPPQRTAAVVEGFTRRVQPILINNCTTAGCHHIGGGQKFQLDRALVYGQSTRRTTMTNLAAALTLVDRTRPQLSPLLTVPRAPHGGMERPVFGPQQAKLVGQLAEWVALVVDSPAADKPADFADTPVTKPNANNTLQSTERDPPVPTEPPAGPRYGAEVQVWRPKDAFDPEIFNRHFRVDRWNARK